MSSSKRERKDKFSLVSKGEKGEIPKTQHTSFSIYPPLLCIFLFPRLQDPLVPRYTLWLFKTKAVSLMI